MNDITRLEALKIALREEDMPLFSDDELNQLIKTSDSLNEAIYKGAIIKSENTTLIVSGLTTADTSAYFLRIAAMYRPNNSGVLRGD